jgi:hypothetical protein
MLLIKQHKKEEREEKEALQAIIGIKDTNIPKQEKVKAPTEILQVDNQENPQAIINTSPVISATENVKMNIQI